MKVHALVLLFGFLQFSEALVDIENPMFDQTMEKKVNELISEALKEYKTKIDQLEEHILKQERRITALEDGCKVKKNRPLMFTWRDPKIENMASKVKNPKVNDKDIIKKDGIRQTERVSRVIPGAGQPVGFYAYLSTSENHPSTHHTLVFDVVRTNAGSAYNKFTGAFSAPVEGTYVFSWTVTAYFHSYIRTEIIINASSFGQLITDGEEINDIHASSRTIVAHLNPGDVVYIRTHSSLPSGGNIYSGANYGETSFSGWKI